MLFLPFGDCIGPLFSDLEVFNCNWFEDFFEISEESLWSSPTCPFFSEVFNCFPLSTEMTSDFILEFDASFEFSKLGILVWAVIGKSFERFFFSFTVVEVEVRAFSESKFKIEEIIRDLFLHSKRLEWIPTNLWAFYSRRGCQGMISRTKARGPRSLTFRSHLNSNWGHGSRMRSWNSIQPSIQ